MADKKISALTTATTPLAGTEVLPIVQSSSTVKVAVSNLTAGRDVSAQSITVNQSGMTTAASFGQFPGSTTYGQVNFNGATTLGALSGLIGGGSSGTMFLNVPTGGTMNLLNGGGFVLQLGTSDVTLSVGNLIQGTAAKGVNFTANTPAAGMTSQLLNAYEEGTWTPSIGGTATYSAQVGEYVKVGKLVFVYGRIIISSIGSGDTMTVSGLPFSVKSASGAIAGKGAVGYFSNLATAVFSITPDAVGGTTTFNFNAVTGLSATGTATNSPAVFQNSTRIDFSLVYESA